MVYWRATLSGCRCSYECGLVYRNVPWKMCWQQQSIYSPIHNRHTCYVRFQLSEQRAEMHVVDLNSRRIYRNVYDEDERWVTIAHDRNEMIKHKKWLWISHQWNWDKRFHRAPFNMLFWWILSDTWNRKISLQRLNYIFIGQQKNIDSSRLLFHNNKNGKNKVFDVQYHIENSIFGSVRRKWNCKITVADSSQQSGRCLDAVWNDRFVFISKFSNFSILTSRVVRVRSSNHQSHLIAFIDNEKKYWNIFQEKYNKMRP